MSSIIECKASDKKSMCIIESLAKEIWQEHYTSIIGKTQVDYMIGKFQSVDAVQKQINEGFLYYLIKNQAYYAGYLGLTFKHDHCFLSKLYIRSQNRGNGLAKQALVFIENLTRKNNFSKIILTVNKNNINSIAAYQKLGFNITESLIMDIGNGFIMDDYVMSMSL